MDLKEKLRLSGQLNSLIKELRDGSLSLKDRIAKGKERIVILKKLKADSMPKADVISLDDFKAMGRTDKIKALDVVMSYPNWYEYEMAFYPDYSVLEQKDNYVVFRTRSGVNFGYKGRLSREHSYWKDKAGKESENQGNGSWTWNRAERSKAMKLINKYQDEADKELTIEEKFKLGEYASSDRSIFRRVLEMLEDKLSLDELKAGTVKWFEYHQSELATTEEVAA